MDTVSIQLDKTSNIPLYLQISNTFEDMIKSDKLKSEEKLPPIRKLAKELDVNNVTVVNAYKQLELNGYILGVKGSGYYVKKFELVDSIASNKKIDYSAPIHNDDYDYEYENIKLMISGQIEISENTINFASATPDPSIFPIETFKNALNEVLDRDKGYAFGYQESNGYEPLRESLSYYLLRENNIKVDSETIQIVSGAQQGIDIIGKALLNSGDYVITENPTYTGAVSVFNSRGANVIGVPIDNDGINLEILEKQIKTYNPKLLYVMTSYQNPTTTCYSKEKILKLLELANKYNFFIVEDDSLSGLSFSMTSKNLTLKSLDTQDKVIYVKSFSKLLMPGLRIGFIISPESMLTKLTEAKHTTDISSSGLIQRALNIYFENGHWQHNLEYMRQIYKNKYNCMIEELNKLKKYNIEFKEPKGGLNFWITLPSNVSASKLYLECAKKDVLLVPCSVFYINNGNKLDNSIRISYAGTNIEDIKKGMSILGECLEKIINKKSNKTYIAPML